MRKVLVTLLFGVCSTAQAVSLIWPNTCGQAGQVLTVDASCNTSWTTVAGISAPTATNYHTYGNYYPSTCGASGQVLVTDGFCNYSWQSLSGGLSVSASSNYHQVGVQPPIGCGSANNILATDGNCNTVWTVASSTPVPTNLLALVATNSSIQASFTGVNWSPSQYVLTASSNSSFSPIAASSITAPGSSGTNTLTDSGLSVNIQYFLEAGALLGATTYYSSAISTYTLANAPATAVSTYTAVTPVAVTLQWTANSNPTGTLYNVTGSTASNFTGTLFNSANINGLSTTISGLTSNTAYFFEAQAINGSGILTSFTALGSTTTHPENAPTALAFTAVQASSITSSFTGAADVTGGYILAASTNSSNTPVWSSSATASNSAGSTSLTNGLDVALTPNTTYWIRAGAVYPDNTVYATNITTSTLANAPTAQAITFTGVFQTSAAVQWAANRNPSYTLYNLVASTASNFTGTLFSSNSIVGTSGIVTGLTAGTTYSFEVKAINSNSVSTAFLSLGSTTTAVASTNLNSGLIAFWNLDEAAGANNATDAISTYTLTQSGSPGSGAGAGANTVTSRAFASASTQRFTISSSLAPGLNLGQYAAFTYTMWVFPTNAGNTSGIWGNWSGAGSPREILIYQTGQKFNVTTSTDGANVQTTCTWGSTFTTSTWYFLTIQWDGANLSLDINNSGTPVTNPLTKAPQTNTTQVWSMGGYSSNQLYLDGRIDAVGFWTRKLTAAELTSLYNAGTGLQPSGGHF